MAKAGPRHRSYHGLSLLWVRTILGAEPVVPSAKEFYEHVKRLRTLREEPEVGDVLCFPTCGQYGDVGLCVGQLGDRKFFIRLDSMGCPRMMIFDPKTKDYAGSAPWPAQS